MMSMSDHSENADQDLENPTPPTPAPAPTSAAVTTGRKWKVSFYGTFVVAAIAISITLGIILPRNAEVAVSNSPASSEGAANSNDVLTLIDSTEDEGETTESTSTSTTAPATTEPGSITAANNPVTVAVASAESSSTEAPESTTESPNTPSTSAPQTDPSSTTQFILSTGPLEAKVRMIDPSAVNSYDSCDDLRDDIINALKHYANSIITSEVSNDWWAKCDPNDPNWNPWGGNYYPQFPIAYQEDGAAMELAAPEMAATATVDNSAKVQEDSYGTNNQVEGVDEADIVKSDGVHVFAAYGDLLYAWNATDGSKGTSVTPMPYNETNCTDTPYPMPIIEPLIYEYEDEELVSDGSSSPESTSSSSGEKTRKRQQRKRETMSMPWYPPCYNPKPQILSLLLHETRLTAIVSENNYIITPYSEDSTSLLSDSSGITIRVYDVSEVPTDGSPLTLLGERKLKGNYNAARSIDNTGVVVTTSYVDTHVMANSLYRSQPLYCGLNNTEYEEKASLIALNRTELFADSLISELDLEYGCDQVFQISAMQSGNSSDATNGDLLSQFVSVVSFDTAADYIDEEIPISLSGSFSNGYISNVYVAQDFVAALAVGSSYNQNTLSWDSSTYILGFDISNPTPVPYSYGNVAGSPINQYSTDLFEDHLRIATTEWQWSETDGSRTTNKIFVLDLPTSPEIDASMNIVGVTDHLGKPNESIYAVRFMGDKAYVVTFEQIDPFIVVDLSDVTDPRPIGELELPGYSSYLHPIEIDGTKLMLGVGQDVNTTTGWTTGVKISLFDITDPENPVEKTSYVDQNAYSNAQHDFHSFRYLPLNQKLILPQSEYTWGAEGNFDGFIVYDITADEITKSHSISHASSNDIYSGCWYQAYMAPRSLVFQSKVTTILSHTVLSTDLDDGTLEWELTLEGLNKTDCGGYFYGYY